MNKKELLATATFLVLYTSFIFAGFNWMLSVKIKAEIAPIKENQARLETRMNHMEKQMDRIMSKLDQILIAQNTHHKGKIRSAGKAQKVTKPASRKTATH